jgi:hypothetical protein
MLATTVAPTPPPAPAAPASVAVVAAAAPTPTPAPIVPSTPVPTGPQDETTALYARLKNLPPGSDLYKMEMEHIMEMYVHIPSVVHSFIHCCNVCLCVV